MPHLLCRKSGEQWQLSIPAAQTNEFEEYLHEVHLNAYVKRRSDLLTDYLITGDKIAIEEHLSFYFDGQYEVIFEHE
jgi:hypothetical protein